MRVLVTGFEPFGDSPVNPSQLVVQRLEATPPPGADFTFRILPVVYNEASDLLRDELDRIRPELLISIGQGGGAGLHIERTAVNVNDVRPGRSDNAGNSPADEIASPESPDGHFATIPVRALATHLRENGFPAQVSNSAGTFLCNHVMFAGLDFAVANGFPRQAGFIHTPLLPEQAAALEGDLRPSMSLDLLEQGIRAALAWLVEQRQPLVAGLREATA